MTEKEYTNTIRNALAVYGYESQAAQCAEECGELIAALSHYRRGRADKADVITELADVRIMIDQLIHHFGAAEVVAELERKAARLKERLRERQNLTKYKM